jgi:hypothetical protein
VGANANPGPNLRSVSCVAVGSCAAVGNYEDTSLYYQGVLLTDNNGKWTPTKAMLPMHAAADPAVSLDSVSCVGTLDCAAAGKYLPNMGEAQGLLISATSGSWGTGTEATLPSGGSTAQPNAISCASAGNCTAVGYYVDSMNNQHGLLLTETAGNWADGVESPVPSGAINVAVLAVSCWAPGNCGAVGNDGLDGLLLGESDGSWNATDATLPSGGTLGDMAAVSCPGTAICTGGGSYRDSSTNDDEGLFVSTAPPLASPTLALTAPANGTAGTAIAASAISAKLSGASAPTGSVRFIVFGPQSAPPAHCGSGGTTVGSGNASGVTGIHPSAGFTPASAGDYWWYASYGGDSRNNPATSACGAGTPETVVAGASVLAPEKPRVSGQRVSDAMACRGGSACSVTVKLTITEKVKGKGKAHRQKRETLVLGSKSATIAAARIQTLTVPLNATGKRLLALHHVLVARLSVVFRGKTVAVYTVTFRAAPHRKT